MTPWYEVVAGMWGVTGVLIVAVVVLWEVVVRPLRRNHPVIARQAEWAVAGLFIAGFVAVFAVRYAQAVA